VVFAGSAVVLADDHVVLFDKDVDFTAFKTFLAQAPIVSSERPELKFPAVASAILDAARAALKTRGLAESNAASDLALGIILRSDDYGVGPYGRLGIVHPPQRGRPGTSNGLTVAYTEAVLVVDLRRKDNTLIWRGVYRDSDESQSKLADNLPKHATSLLSEYPPRKSK